MLRPPIFVGSDKERQWLEKQSYSFPCCHKIDHYLLYTPAMAKFNCGMLSVLGTFPAVVESLFELEEKDQTFLRGLVTG